MFLARRARFRPLLLLLRLLVSSRAFRLVDLLVQVAVALLLLRSRCLLVPAATLRRGGGGPVLLRGRAPCLFVVVGSFFRALAVGESDSLLMPHL